MSLYNNDYSICLAARHLSKKFCKNLRRSMFYGICDIAKSTCGIRTFKSSLRKHEFWAVDDITFELKKREILGIIGPNGCGKTTILRILAGIFPPDKGEVFIKGRISSILAIGAGFHPHLTVRENIYINGTILGMTHREVDEKFDFIIEFSGLENFINTPVAALSDGMYVRLGLSTAIAVKPDIFLIDEVLALADREFRGKYLDEIRKLSSDTAIVFVSHNMETVKNICNRIIVIQQGKVVFKEDNVNRGVEYYTLHKNS